MKKSFQTPLNYKNKTGNSTFQWKAGKDPPHSHCYKVIPPICILAFNLFRNLQVVQVHKNWKDALWAIWLGVSKGCSSSLLAWSIQRMLFKPVGLEYPKGALWACWLRVSKGCSSSLMAGRIEWILLFGEMSIYQFRYWHSTLFISRRRRDNPSSIRQLKRILQHKATLMEEEHLHNNLVIPDVQPPIWNPYEVYSRNIPCIFRICLEYITT